MHMCCVYWNIKLEFFSLITSKMVSSLLISTVLPGCKVSYPVHSNLCMYEGRPESRDRLTIALFRSTLQHPAYSRNLDLIDSHLFPTLKEFLGFRHFRSDIEVQGFHKVVIKWTGSRGLWRRHTKTHHTLWQVPKCWWWLCWKIT